MPRKVQSKPPSETPAPPVALVPAEIMTFYPPAALNVTAVPCIVCGSETRSDLAEQLCWVCRRLKISAWRDSEPMPAQE